MNKIRRHGNHHAFAAAVALAISTFVLGHARASDMPASVDAARLNRADRDAANWLSYGRTYSEQRFSPLAKITPDNAKQLGLAWFADLDTNRGQQATPLVVDGVMYVSTAWSMVKAYDGATGKLLWSYDPEVPRETRREGLLRRRQPRRRGVERQDLCRHL